MKIFIAAMMVALNVTIHAIGITWMLKKLERPDVTQFWISTWFLIRVAILLILMHLLEIGLWGLCYLWERAMPDLLSALYFSSVTYTTVGYGDLVLPEGWRLFGGVEALTGILMCGWSTGFFFSVVSKMQRS
jgi:hypothetical protein